MRSLGCLRGRPLACALILLLCAPAIGLAQGQGVTVRAVSPKLQDAAPGHILSLSFLVTNHTAGEEEFIENLQPPAGWQGLIPPGSFRLRPAEATTRLMAVQVPLSAAAGRYEMSYGVRSQRDYAIQDADTIMIAVASVTKLALLVQDKPDSVIAGETYEIKLLLANQSNVELKVKLEVSTDEKYSATVEPPELTLAAGQSAPLVVTVQTDAQERRPHTQYVRIEAQAEGTGHGQVTTEISVGVEIITRVTGELDAYHRLPVDLTVSVGGRGGDIGWQAEARGVGSLDEAGTQRVEFLFRGPDIQDKGTFGQHDEYRLNYATDDLGIQLGDQTYGLSRLTSYYRYGRGLGVQYHPADNPTKLGAYFLRERWAEPDRQEFGAYVERRLSDRLSARLNFLRRERGAGEAQPAFDDTLWSLQASLKPRDDMNLELEYARSHSSRDGGVQGDAYRVEWDGRIGQGGYYRAAKFHAGPDYDGYYHDSDFSYASLSYPLARRLQANLSYNRYESNLDLMPANEITQRETLWQAGVNRSLDHGWYVSLNYDDFARYTRVMASQSDFREQALRLGVGRSAQKYSFRVEVRGGNQEDRITGQSKTAFDYSFFTTYRPRRDTFFTLFAGFGDSGALSGSRLLGASNNLGASVSWRPRPDMDVDFWYSRYNFDAGDRSPSDQYTFSLKRRLPNSHQIALIARHNTRDLRASETSYQIAYIIPFSWGVSRKKNTGSLRGVVYDAAAPQRPGVVGAILRINGATAVTGPTGEFVFPSVPPGTYQLTVDRASIGLDRVTQQKLPLTVEVAGGKATQVELGVVGAANVSGRVLLIPANGNGHAANSNRGDGPVGANGNGSGSSRGAAVVGEPGSSTRYVAPTGLANVLVEITNGDEVLRRLTDGNGNFLFENLRPGPWRLKVHDFNVPAYYALEKTEEGLVLQPGQTVHVEARVIPKVREIRFIDVGSIRSNGNGVGG